MTLTRAAVATIKPLTEPSLLTTGETAQEFLLKLMLGLTWLELGTYRTCKRPIQNTTEHLQDPVLFHLAPLSYKTPPGKASPGSL